MPTAPEPLAWIAEGAPVAESVPGQNGYVFATIKRITATLVVLDDGTRWRRDTLRKVGDFSKYSRTRLVPADRAYNALIKELVRLVEARVSQAAFRVNEKAADPTAVLDEMAAVVADAQREMSELVARRAAIQNPEVTQDGQ